MPRAKQRAFWIVAPCRITKQKSHLSFLRWLCSGWGWENRTPTSRVRVYRTTTMQIPNILFCFAGWAARRVLLYAEKSDLSSGFYKKIYFFWKRSILGFIFRYSLYCPANRLQHLPACTLKFDRVYWAYRCWHFHFCVDDLAALHWNDSPSVICIERFRVAS